MPDIITVPLPADLPENWLAGQTIAPTGGEVGLSPQHGYNYLMQQVNNAQTAAKELGTGLEGANGAIEELQENAGSFILMTESLPPAQRKAKTLYALVLQDYGGES